MGRGAERARDFGLGLLIGAVVIALVWTYYPGFWRAPVSAGLEAAMQHREALRAAAESATARQAARTPAAAAPAGAAADCAFAPLLAPSSAADRQFALRAALAIDKTGEPGPYVDVAREVAAAGRVRDAEVALIVACRLAARQAGGPTVALADVQERLADHYASAATVEDARAARARIWARARSLYGASLQTYLAVLGGQSSRTRTAQARLEGLEQDRATLFREASEIAADQPALATMAAGALPPQPPAKEVSPAVAANTRPPAPAPARGPAAQQLLRSDPELAQLESDRRRLTAQVEAVSADPASVRQRSAQALAQRDARCHDKACLLQWYARRRSELLDAF